MALELNYACLHAHACGRINHELSGVTPIPKLNVSFARRSVCEGNSNTETPIPAVWMSRYCLFWNCDISQTRSCMRWCSVLEIHVLEIRVSELLRSGRGRFLLRDLGGGVVRFDSRLLEQILPRGRKKKYVCGSTPSLYLYVTSARTP